MEKQNTETPAGAQYNSLNNLNVTSSSKGCMAISQILPTQDALNKL